MRGVPGGSSRRLTAVAAVTATAPRPQLAARPSLRAASEALLGDHDPRLSRAAVQALVQVGDEPARRALSAYYPRTASPRERRAIEGLFPAGE